MTEFDTATESETGQKFTPQQISEITAARESRLSHLLMLYVGTGSYSCSCPARFLGFGISSQSAVGTRRPQFLQRGFKPTAMPRFLAGSAALFWASGSTQFPNYGEFNGSPYGLSGRLGLCGPAVSHCAGSLTYTNGTGAFSCPFPRFSSCVPFCCYNWHNPLHEVLWRV